MEGGWQLATAETKDDATPTLPSPLKGEGIKGKGREAGRKLWQIYISVTLNVAKGLVFPHSYEILRWLRSLRMTGEKTFAEVS